MSMELSTFKTSFRCEKLKTNAECLPSLDCQEIWRNLNVLRKHSIVILSLFTPFKRSIVSSTMLFLFKICTYKGAKGPEHILSEVQGSKVKRIRP